MIKSFFTSFSDRFPQLSQAYEKFSQSCEQSGVFKKYASYIPNSPLALRVSIAFGTVIAGTAAIWSGYKVAPKLYSWIRPNSTANDIEKKDRAGNIEKTGPVSKPSDPAPVKKTDPAPVKKTDPAPVKKTDPAPVKKTDPAPVKKTDPTPVKKTDPTPVKKTDPDPKPSGPAPAEASELTNFSTPTPEMEIPFLEENFLDDCRREKITSKQEQQKVAVISVDEQNETSSIEINKAQVVFKAIIPTPTEDVLNSEKERLLEELNQQTLPDEDAAKEESRQQLKGMLSKNVLADSLADFKKKKEKANLKKAQQALKKLESPSHELLKIKKALSRLNAQATNLESPSQEELDKLKNDTHGTLTKRFFALRLKDLQEKTELDAGEMKTIESTLNTLQDNIESKKKKLIENRNIIEQKFHELLKTTDGTSQWENKDFKSTMNDRLQLNQQIMDLHLQVANRTWLLDSLNDQNSELHTVLQLYKAIRNQWVYSADGFIMKQELEEGKPSPVYDLGTRENFLRERHNALVERIKTTCELYAPLNPVSQEFLNKTLKQKDEIQ